MKNTINNIIKKLELLPHPEGGYYKQTYKSAGEIDLSSLGDRYTSKRSYSTCIYFLLTSESFSAFHRIKQDEIWHFYDGSPILLHIITESGNHTTHLIGRDIQNGEVPQFVVPGGVWFAAEATDDNSYSLVGCTVAPGFDFEDFELKSKKELITLFPEREEIISKLSRD